MSENVMEHTKLLYNMYPGRSKQLEKKISELRRHADDLEAELCWQQETFSHMSHTQKLACILHEKQCKNCENKEAPCGWNENYGKEADLCKTVKIYMEKAEKLLEALDNHFQKAVAAVEAVL